MGTYDFEKEGSIMRKLFAEKKTGRKKHGVILITVVFIMAVALIFIVSALMLTTATRSRVYESAFNNQARLTVTSVAEAFYQALQAQEITDAAFESLKNKTININGDMPGMQGDADSYTTAHFEECGGGIKVTFTTRIGDSIECIDMILQKTDDGEPAIGFSRQMELGDGANLVRANVGGSVTGGPYTGPTNGNTILSYGDLNINIGNPNIYSDIFSLGVLTGHDTHFFGDIYFVGPDAGLGVNTQTVTFDNPESTAYFINNDSAFYWYDGDNFATGANTPVDPSMANPGGSTEARSRTYVGGGRVVFADCDNVTMGTNALGNYNGDQCVAYGVSEEGDLQFGDGDFQYYGDGSNLRGNVLEDQQTMIDSLYEQYDSLFDEYGDPINQDVPDAWDEVDDHYGLSSQESSASSLAGSIGINLKTASGSYNLEPGAYKVSGQMGEADGSGAPIIDIDLSLGDYYIFVTDNLTIEDGFFRIVNGGSEGDHKCYFVIDYDKYLQIGVNNTKHPCGIIDNSCYPSVATTDDGSGYVLSAIDQNVTPYTYVFGQGATGNLSNPPQSGDSVANEGQLRLGGPNGGSNGYYHLIAYVGMYPSTDGAGDAGAFTFSVADAVTFYGRVTCNTFGGYSGGALNVPYCPAPGSTPPPPNPFDPINSEYSLYDFQYYSVAVP